MASEIEMVLQMLAERRQAADPDAGVAEMRAGFEETGRMMPRADGVHENPVELGGVRGLTFAPETDAREGTVLYFHGGGYMIGSPSTHASLTSHLAAFGRVTVHSMDYRMAPEAPFPAALDDGVTAYRALLGLGIQPERVVIGGDSAGGGLALATAMRARDEGLPAPAGLYLISPWSDLTLSGESYTTRAERDPMVTREGLTGMAAAYAGGTALSDPGVSPLLGDLSGLAPMLVQVGDEEVLLSDSTGLAEKVEAAGGAVTLEVFPEMVHVFQFFHPFLSVGRQAIADAAAWIAARTD